MKDLESGRPLHWGDSRKTLSLDFLKALVGVLGVIEQIIAFDPARISSVFLYARVANERLAKSLEKIGFQIQESEGQWNVILHRYLTD